MLHIIIILKYKELLIECKSIYLIELIVSSHDIRNYIFFASAMAYTYTQRIYVFQEKGSISESKDILEGYLNKASMICFS